MRLKLEGLEDRIVPSASTTDPLSVVAVASPPPVPSVAAITSYVGTMMELRDQLIATIEQDLSSYLNALGQEVSFVEQQWDRIFGINPSPTTPAHSSSDSAAGQGHASGSGSGSGATPDQPIISGQGANNAQPVTSGSGSGIATPEASSSFNATVTGQVWLDNNGDGSLDDNEMDYSGAGVSLLYQVSSSGGSTWSTLASTTTNGNQEGNNYSIPVMVPPGDSYTCEIRVAVPLNFGVETSSDENDINALGFSPVFSLSAGDEEVVPGLPHE